MRSLPILLFSILILAACCCAVGPDDWIDPKTLEAIVKYGKYNAQSFINNVRETHKVVSAVGKDPAAKKIVEKLPNADARKAAHTLLNVMAQAEKSLNEVLSPAAEKTLTEAARQIKIEDALNQAGKSLRIGGGNPQQASNWIQMQHANILNALKAKSSMSTPFIRAPRRLPPFKPNLGVTTTGLVAAGGLGYYYLLRDKNGQQILCRHQRQISDLSQGLKKKVQVLQRQAKKKCSDMQKSIRKSCFNHKKNKKTAQKFIQSTRDGIVHVCEKIASSLVVGSKPRK